MCSHASSEGQVEGLGEDEHARGARPSWVHHGCPVYAHTLNEQPLLGAGGCGPRRDVLDRPCAAAVPPHSKAAGADGVRDARDLCRSLEESGAVPGGGRAASAGTVVLAHAGGVLQRGAGAFHEVCVWKISTTSQHC